MPRDRGDHAVFGDLHGAVRASRLVKAVCGFAEVKIALRLAGGIVLIVAVHQDVVRVFIELHVVDIRDLPRDALDDGRKAKRGDRAVPEVIFGQVDGHRLPLVRLQCKFVSHLFFVFCADQIAAELQAGSHAVPLGGHPHPDDEIVPGLGVDALRPVRIVAVLPFVFDEGRILLDFNHHAPVLVGDVRIRGRGVRPVSIVKIEVEFGMRVRAFDGVVFVGPVQFRFALAAVESDIVDQNFSVPLVRGIDAEGVDVRVAPGTRRGEIEGVDLISSIVRAHGERRDLGAVDRLSFAGEIDVELRARGAVAHLNLQNGIRARLQSVRKDIGDIRVVFSLRHGELQRVVAVGRGCILVRRPALRGIRKVELHHGAVGHAQVVVLPVCGGDLLHGFVKSDPVDEDFSGRGDARVVYHVEAEILQNAGPCGVLAHVEHVDAVIGVGRNGGRTGLRFVVPRGSFGREIDFGFAPCRAVFHAERQISIVVEGHADLPAALDLRVVVAEHDFDLAIRRLPGSVRVIDAVLPALRALGEVEEHLAPLSFHGRIVLPAGGKLGFRRRFVRIEFDEVDADRIAGRIKIAFRPDRI